MGLGPDGAALGFVSGLRGDDQSVLFHQPLDTLLVDRYSLAALQVRPDPAVAPERVVGLDFFDLFQDYRLTRD